MEYSKHRKACEILEGIHADEFYRVMAEVIYYKGCISKLHETPKRFGVSVMGTFRNVTNQKWKRWPKRWLKRHICLYIYIYISE